MEVTVPDDKLRGIEGYISKCVKEELGANYKTKATQDFFKKR